ncbi:MAG: hypothetical protein DRP71_05555 [Verrucomicrobia bacterium]|nr:MAG: hypothetical protein DRP71_05555 [Verrucomicrobiota bacterium]
MANDKKKPFLSRFKIAIAILGIILIPLVMDQMEISKEDVRLVGRVCAGIAGIFTLYGIFTKLLRVFSFIIIAAVITLTVLISEGVLEAPHLFS